MKLFRLAILALFLLLVIAPFTRSSSALAAQLVKNEQCQKFKKKVKRKCVRKFGRKTKKSKRCTRKKNQVKAQADPDCDGVESTDNCPEVYNVDQLDTNNNGTGNACEDDGDPDPSRAFVVSRQVYSALNPTSFVSIAYLVVDDPTGFQGYGSFCVRSALLEDATPGEIIVRGGNSDPCQFATPTGHSCPEAVPLGRLGIVVYSAGAVNYTNGYPQSLVTQQEQVVLEKSSDTYVVRPKLGGSDHCEEFGLGLCEAFPDLPSCANS